MDNEPVNNVEAVALEVSGRYQVIYKTENTNTNVILSKNLY